MKQTSATLALCALIIGLFLTITAAAAQTDITGPAGSGTFGSNITVLPNGNIVVVDAGYDLSGPTVSDVGAVHLYNGTTLALISTLTGSTAGDSVGSNGITVLSNGNYVVSSANWDNPSPLIANVGAVTWCSATTGCSSVISAANSLIGGTAGDQVGSSGGSVTALTNGNYVVRSPNWDNPSPLIVGVGAVTWGNGSGGTIGLVTAANSLVGGTVGDQVGILVTILSNGNYVVSSSNWDNPSPLITNVGAATWGNGNGGTVGLITASNSLIGSTASDGVGGSGVTALTNGNYVVRSSLWDNPSPVIINVGAVTWGNGSGGTIGLITAANSLIGGRASDEIGNLGTTALTNGNYVVRSSDWDNPSPLLANASAFTFGNGASGTNGLITSGTGGGNSVIGTVANGTSNFAFDATRNRLIVGRSPSNIVSVLSFTTTAITDGDLNNAANWSGGLPNGLVTGIIPSGRAMTISSVMNIGQLQVQCGGSLTGGSASAYIVGSVRKDFCAAVGESFTYPIGDANNYSPLNVANANGTGNLTAAVTDTFMPGLPATTRTLSRYWSLEGAGITANLTFNYVNADVNGTESDYKVFRRPVNNNALITQHAPSLVDVANNTITAFNVSQFSDWGVGAQPLAPLAAGVSVSGRVMTKEGNGIRNVVVTLIDSSGTTRTARTSTFGYYTFEDVEVGATYTVNVSAKRFTFANPTQIISVKDSIADLDFIAE